ncbi:FecR family protein [Pedobacter sp. MW01-1-1]|uniref:FecR family protein n=1 Tax=Pedobacter sp. MW01-1-1 TaxID=3383027 RepID=UPI003FEE4C0E
MHVDQKLVEKFFAGHCTAEEARWVSKFLEEPINRKLYLDPTEWENYVPTELVNKEVSDRVFVNVLNHIHYKREAKRAKLRFIGYAASALLVVSTGLFFYKSQEIKPIPLAQNDRPLKVKNTERKLTRFINTSKHVKTNILPDGTIVELNPNTEISFYPFDHGKRDVTLIGEGLFKVHKDKTKPFTVYANNLATTALGTVFRITAFKKSPFTKVELLEGKVVVKPQEKLREKGVQQVYLEPGKSFTVNMKTFQSFISNTNEIVTGKKTLLTINKVIITEKGITFNNEPLEHVFNTLQEELNVKIEYNTKLVSKMVFSGQYEFGHDEMESFLTMLCALNNLVVEKNEKGYIIRKQTNTAINN